MGDPAGGTSFPRPFGKYTLQGVAGRGGKGIVYEAMDSVLQRRVALKLIQPAPGVSEEDLKDEEERFLIEARLSAQLPKHPHIVTVYEAAEVEGKRTLACELIDGVPMHQWRKTPAATFAQQVRLLRDVALALDHVHRNGVIHRDLKPGNILVDTQGQPHITDFGLAKMVGQKQDLVKAAPGKVWGTPSYMSPEHARGLATVDARTDIYSLGAMLYDQLAGHPPFHDADKSDLLRKVVNEAVPSPSGLAQGPWTPIHKALEGVCLKALSKDPAARQATAKDFADEVGRCLEPRKSIRREVAAPGPAPAKSPVGLLVGIGAAVVVVVIAVIALSGGSGPKPPDPEALRAEQAKIAQRVEQEKRQAVSQATAEALRGAEEQSREEKARLEREKQAREEEMLRLKVAQARADADRREAVERARKAEEALKEKPPPPEPAVPVPPTPAPTPAVPVPPPTPVPAQPAPNPFAPAVPNGDPKVLADGVFQWEAEDYSGGETPVEGRDYHDLTPRNSGRTYRQQDVDITTFNNMQATCVVDIQPGEWLNYRFPGEGRYDVEVRYMGRIGGTVHFEIDGFNVTGPLPLPPLQDGNLMATATGSTQAIAAGTHDLRLVFDTRVVAVDSFKLKKFVPPPPPAAGPLKESQKLIRDLFKADFAKKAPADVQALAKKLYQEALRTEGDPVARYALLVEARDLAVQSGDVGTALPAVDELERRYAVDGPALRSAALTSLARNRTPETARAVAEAYVGLADQAAARDDFDTALAHMGKAETSSRSSQDPSLVGRIQAREKEITSLRDEVRALKTPLKTLEERPDDPAANLAVGLYRCFTRGDWAKGLPLLAKGSDAAIAAMAKKELAGATDGPQRLALGDGWREAGEKKSSGTLKSRCLSRALVWYEKALPDLPGLERVKVEGQIEQLYKATGSDSLRKGLVFWVEPGREPSDPFRDLVFGSKASNNGASAASDGASRVLSFNRTNVEYAASEAVKAVDKHGAIFAWIKTDPAALGGYVTFFGRGERGQGGGQGQDDFNLWVGARGELAAWFNRPENQQASYSRGTVKAGTWTHCGVVWDDSGLVFYLDGKEDVKFQLPPLAIPVRRAAKVSLGNNLSQGGFYTGFLGSVHLYNRTVTAAEANQLYVTSRGRFR